MKLHIFNPEHDMALASNCFNFVAPHAGREMRADLGFLPALWADKGDFVLVDDIAMALNRVRHLRRYAADVVFVTSADLSNLSGVSGLSPWGWDRTLCSRLQRSGLPASLFPSDNFLDRVRDMSHRNWAKVHLLDRLVEANNEYIGSSMLITSMEQIDAIREKSVIKAPWSSSGRGLRYVDGLTAHQRGWAKNVIARQGAVMLEPFYRKLKDFAVEFMAYEDRVEFVGLSVFQSVNGAYAGNVIATEEEKQEIIGKYIPFDRVCQAVDDICHIMNDEMVGKYVGPFGVDMMIVDENGIKLHPCVELNLRRTMGHVALSIDSHIPNNARKLMSISYDTGYHFRVLTTAENCLSSVW